MVKVSMPMFSYTYLYIHVYFKDRYHDYLDAIPCFCFGCLGFTWVVSIVGCSVGTVTDCGLGCCRSLWKGTCLNTECLRHVRHLWGDLFLVQLWWDSLVLKQYKYKRKITRHILFEWIVTILITVCTLKNLMNMLYAAVFHDKIQISVNVYLNVDNFYLKHSRIVHQ